MGVGHSMSSCVPQDSRVPKNEKIKITINACTCPLVPVFLVVKITISFLVTCVFCQQGSRLSSARLQCGPSITNTEREKRWVTLQCIPSVIADTEMRTSWSVFDEVRGVQAQRWPVHSTDPASPTPTPRVR